MTLCIPAVPCHLLETPSEPSAHCGSLLDFPWGQGELQNILLHHSCSKLGAPSEMLSAWYLMLTIQGLDASHLRLLQQGGKSQLLHVEARLHSCLLTANLGSTSSVLTWDKSWNWVEHLWDPTGSQLSLSFPFLSSYVAFQRRAH